MVANVKTRKTIIDAVVFNRKLSVSLDGWSWKTNVVKMVVLDISYLIVEYSVLAVSTNVVMLLSVDVVSMLANCVTISSTVAMAVLYSAIRLFISVQASAETKTTL